MHCSTAPMNSLYCLHRQELFCFHLLSLISCGRLGFQCCRGMCSRTSFPFNLVSSPVQHHGHRKVAIAPNKFSIRQILVLENWVLGKPVFSDGPIQEVTCKIIYLVAIVYSSVESICINPAGIVVCSPDVTCHINHHFLHSFCMVSTSKFTRYPDPELWVAMIFYVVCDGLLGLTTIRTTRPSRSTSSLWLVEGYFPSIPQNCFWDSKTMIQNGTALRKFVWSILLLVGVRNGKHFLMSINRSLGIIDDTWGIPSRSHDQ